MRNITSLILLFLCLACPSYLGATESAPEYKDFGVRIIAGGITGIGPSPTVETGVESDFHFLSQQIRLTFGSTLVIPRSDLYPLLAIHGLGLELNQPLGRHTVFIGARYFKSFVQSLKNNLKGQKGFSYFAGYKYALQPRLDLVLKVGVIEQPFRLTSPNPAISLADRPFYWRVGSEWYF